MGAHLLEFDLQVTADDKLVVAHDPYMPGSNSQPVKIAELSMKQLRGRVADPDLPSLPSVVEAAREAGLGLYVDVKTLSAGGATWLVDVLHDFGMADRAVLASSETCIVRRCADVAPEIPRAILFVSTIVDPVRLAASVDANFVHPCWETLPAPHELLAGGWLKRVRENGLGVICWHEERRVVLEQLWSLGVDGVCTDDPALLTLVATEHR